ncbi:MAG: hypothetical protein KF896_08750 [Ignavibacteriae bacterium]|nr:hypothetical protein [Ignavibacteriota bacterium]
MTDFLKRGDRKTAYNTGFASGGVKCKLGALCFVSSAVLVDSFVLRNPPERKARKRSARFASLILLNSQAAGENKKRIEPSPNMSVCRNPVDFAYRLTIMPHPKKRHNEPRTNDEQILNVEQY